MDALFSDPVFMMQIGAALAVTGVVAGILAGLLGVGGGIVIVPVLFFLFQKFGTSADMAMFVAVGTSLATIIATSISSVRSHHKKGGVDWPLLRKWTPGVVIGVVAGTVLASALKGQVLTVMFSILAFIVSLRMLLSSKNAHLAEKLPGQPLEFIYAFIIGSISVMIGIGGGSISVPILNAYNVPMRKAVACASGIGLVIAVPGAIGFIVAGWGTEGLPPGSFGYVNLLGFCLIVPLTVLCAPLGAKIAHTVNPEFLKKGFAVFLLITSIKMMLGAF
ncbi:sulfite exporter TauE/SafE family protein [Terasakiella sp. A23]|uniref:sulfite exporter TauE/SafE family protein n=1 Tax=Terasakiella sp. FCG-A23 TaxID=3080561 RepID=UPI002954A5EC|nr:sulfite exporter TauE/SafE family protein [Terasakiella sp. A23]MDV7339363.1 sulfite exporter TauE/SafE family protein [Terasakiella sp. A23]